MCYNVLLLIPTCLVPMKKFLVRKTIKNKKIPMLICCLLCLYVSFMVKNLIELLNLITLFGSPILSLIIPTFLYLNVNKNINKCLRFMILLIIFGFCLLNFYFTLHNLKLEKINLDQLKYYY